MSFDVGGSAFDLPTTAAAASAAAAVPGEAFDPLAAAAAELIRGLKVRIGVATGELDASEEISTSRLLDVTKRRWPGLGPCQGHG
jgi:class 3 adenylate cyclase